MLDRVRLQSLALLSCLVAPTLTLSADFDRDVAPLIIDHCIDCHSGARPKGGLDLSKKSATFKGGKSGAAINVGQPADSVLWQRVRDGEMPPKKKLAPAEIAALKEWIAEGASWGTDPIDPFRITTGKRAGADWWSLQPVSRPALPTVKDAVWPKNAIDHFVLAKLEAKGLKPSPTADRRTLIRRLSFDLVGLPPTPAEVQSFVDDPAPNAYDRLVDKFLASPHYGERWARHWLDVVRFGETDGFERNAARPNAYHYRNWVIRALNEDLPYDDFVRRQIAGDVLASNDAAATGFLVAGIHNTVVPGNKVAQETAFQDELEDLVGSVGQTYLGLTLNCARCHDHKFDPITQKEYYRFASTLSGVRHGERAIVRSTDEVAKLQAEADVLKAELASLQPPGAKTAGPIASWDFRMSGRDRIGDLHVKPHGGAKLTAEGLVLNGTTGFARSEPLRQTVREKTLEVWLRLDRLEQGGGGAMALQNSAAFDAIVFGEREPRVWMAGSDNFRRTSSFQAPAERDADKKIVHLAISYSSDGDIAGYRDGKPYGVSYRSSGLTTFEADKAVVLFGMRHEPSGGNRMLAGAVVRARLYDRALTAEEIAASAKNPEAIVEPSEPPRIAPENGRRRDEIRKRLTTIGAELTRLRSSQSTKVYAALSVQPAVTRLLVRGQVTEPAEVVVPGGIAMVKGPNADFALGEKAADADRRKKLAAWLTDEANPLLRRVMVNRLWHYHFGTGLVETPNDFGFNGARPSHPELLDWLAAEFSARGYRLKEMHKLIVTSAAYRQSSAPRADGLAIDADARLLWRKRPLRIDGESMRDGMLAVAGLLNREVGGKGFTDYKEKGGAGTQYFDPFDPVGPEFHRRSIYRFSPRGGNQGLLDAFDCPDPASATPRRNVTTTPLQALSLWNGAFSLRMADAMAARVTAIAKDDRDLQVTTCYRLAYQREPLAAELTAAKSLVERHGLASLCRAIFNTNEFLTVE